MSIKKNFIYSFILTCSNYVFPLLVFPYVSRKLGVGGIGVCNFIDSIINYFTLFATIGVTIIGIRETAYVKNDYNKLCTTYTSLLLHILIPTAIACVVFVVSFEFIPELTRYHEFLYVGLGKILGTAFLLDWFYKGTENFKFITIRTIVIKLLYILSVFIFVHDSSDYLVFFGLTSLMIILNSIYNLIYSFRFVKLKFCASNFFSLLKSNYINGLYLFLNTMYLTLNVAYLGFVSDTVQVGYYTTANKVFGIILSVYTAFTGVLLPRMSTLSAENNKKEFNALIHKSLNVLITITVPIVMVSTILAPQIIDVISGEGYEGAYIPAMISMPLIFVVGYEQILIIQILTPLKQDGKKLVNAVVGAIVGVVLNVLLVGRFEAIGATLVWACSELAVLLIAQYYVTKLIRLHFPFKQVGKHIFLYVPLCVAIYLFHDMDLSSFAILLISLICSIIYFGVIQYFVHTDELILGLPNRYKRK